MRKVILPLGDATVFKPVRSQDICMKFEVQNCLYICSMDAERQSSLQVIPLFYAKLLELRKGHAGMDKNSLSGCQLE
jgi:hypothetical protein